MDNFESCQYSIDELDAFRDENGFIDLNRAGVTLSDTSRVIIGNINRIKNWVDFAGKKALIKGEAKLENERNYGIYAELIVEELAKKLGIPTAHYDLVKIVDEEGKEVLGVLSESIIDHGKGESLSSLQSLIGNEPEEDEIFPDVTSLYFTLDALSDRLYADGYAESQIERILTDYQKRLLFGLLTVDTDKHTQNIAFIEKIENGKHTIELSPNFDSESAFLLDMDKSTLDTLIEDYAGLRGAVDLAEPRIGAYTLREDGGYQSLWKDSLVELCEDDYIREYYEELKDKGFGDMEEVLNAVESRIHASLPEEVRLIAKYSHQIRVSEMQKLIRNREKNQNRVQNSYSVESILGAFLAKGSDIRSGEMAEIEGKIARDILRTK